MGNVYPYLKRTACFLLAGLLIGSAGVPAALADYKSDWQQSEQQLKQEQKKYNQIKNEKKKAEEQKKSLQNQEKIIKGQITDTVNRINEKAGAIAVQEQAIADQQANIDARWSDFQDRMLAMQVMHNSGAVAMVTSAKSLYDILNFSYNIQQISEKDTAVLEEMNAEKLLLEEEKQKLEDAKAELENAKSSLQKKQNQLAQNIQQQNQTISEKDAQAQAQSVVVEEAQKAADEAERQYEAWVRQNASTGSGQSAEGFIWPLPMAGRVTTEFGADQWVNGVHSTGHSGMDIAVPLNTPIFAAHDGVISSTSGHYTYGNVVMVDNGDGVTTLYAHMNSRAVSVGQQVKQGDVIGYVGSTGNSTGNHLHFEVRVNGRRQNPRNYVSP